jgi:colicin import membrane protein
MTEENNTAAAAAPPPAASSTTCAYPGCERPPRRTASGDGRGAKPKYCDLTDESGKELHTALTAFRARAKLDRSAAGGAVPDDLDRPVTMATVRASELRTGMLADAEQLVTKLSAAVEQLRAAANPEAAEAQIEAVQAEAAEQVADARALQAREAQRRQQAEAGAEEARQAAIEMDEQLATAEQRRAEAERRAGEAAEQAAEVRRSSEQAIAAAHTEAELRVRQAQQQADQQIEEARQHAAADVAAAQAERDRATEHAHAETARAAQAVQSAEAETARARQGETDAKTALADLRQEMTTRLHEQRGTYEERIAELTLARDEARDRAHRAETELDAISAEQRRQSARIDELHTQLANARADLAAAHATAQAPGGEGHSPATARRPRRGGKDQPTE